MMTRRPGAEAIRMGPGTDTLHLRRVEICSVDGRLWSSSFQELLVCRSVSQGRLHSSRLGVCTSEVPFVVG